MTVPGWTPEWYHLSNTTLINNLLWEWKGYTLVLSELSETMGEHG